jgi:hypothetical protein
MEKGLIKMHLQNSCISSFFAVVTTANCLHDKAAVLDDTKKGIIVYHNCIP